MSDSSDNGTVGESDADRALRYSRLYGAVGPRVAGRLQRAAVTLIGAGRNGGALAFQLASLGVRTLRLVDGDRLGLENLDAMPGPSTGLQHRAINLITSAA